MFLADDDDPAKPPLFRALDPEIARQQRLGLLRGAMRMAKSREGRRASFVTHWLQDWFFCTLFNNCKGSNSEIAVSRELAD